MFALKLALNKVHMINPLAFQRVPISSIKRGKHTNNMGIVQLAEASKRAFGGGPLIAANCATAQAREFTFLENNPQNCVPQKEQSFRSSSNPPLLSHPFFYTWRLPKCVVEKHLRKCGGVESTEANYSSKTKTN